MIVQSSKAYKRDLKKLASSPEFLTSIDYIPFSGKCQALFSDFFIFFIRPCSGGSVRKEEQKSA